ncbi:MAG: oligosaccharide flippase family protein [Clostridium sp.]|nr:oligosaccharide flippase family protein [Clostridium sp.]
MADHPTDRVRPPQEEDVSYDHLLKYLGVFGGVQMFTLLMSLIRNKCTTTLLGAAGWGLSAVLMNISTFLSYTTNLGLPFSAVRNLSEIYETGTADEVTRYVAVVRTWSLWTALLGALLCLIGALPISYYAFNGDTGYALHICALAPMVVATAITAGEVAVMKALRRLKNLAVVNLLGGISTLAFTVPLYALYGTQGILPALNLSALALMAINLGHSLRVVPWRGINLFSRRFLCDGLPMVRLGVPFVLASIAHSAVGVVVPSFLLRMDSMAEVALYQWAYALMITYAGMAFAVIDTDYFPRLSAVQSDATRMNILINKQMNVCVLVIAPCLSLLVLLMPAVILALSNAQFLPARGMAVCAAFYTFFKALSLPVAYIPLAKGDSVLFMCMEVVFALIVLPLVVVCYLAWGLTGTGVALSLANLLEWLILSSVYARRYGLRFSPRPLRHAAVQAVCLLTVVAAALGIEGWMRFAVGIPMVTLSAAFSLRMLLRESDFVDRMVCRMGLSHLTRRFTR